MNSLIPENQKLTEPIENLLVAVQMLQERMMNRIRSQESMSQQDYGVVRELATITGHLTRICIDLVEASRSLEEHDSRRTER